MNDNPVFQDLLEPCNQAVEWFTMCMEQAGLQVMRTFDLQSVRQVTDNCPCPHHGTDECDCQMVVLMVYHAHQGPITIIAHGHNHQTWFSLVDTPQQRPNPLLEASIRNLAASVLLPSTGMDGNGLS